MRAPNNAFERWAITAGYDITLGQPGRDFDHKYRSHFTICAEEAWNALISHIKDLGCNCVESLEE